MLRLCKKTQIVMALILILILTLFSGCSNSQNADSTNSQDTTATKEQKSLIELREAAKGATCGVAFIGYYELPFESFETIFEKGGYLDEYSFLTDISTDQFVEIEGDENYCIVPVDEESSVRVNECIYDDDFVGYAGKVLFEANSGEPVLIRGNLSDILPNILVTIISKDGKEQEFIPRLSLMDGSLNMGLGVYDFTIYEATSIDGETILSPADIIGEWVFSNIIAGGNPPFDGRISFYDDGTMGYGYGPPNAGFYVSYVGEWSFIPLNKYDSQLLPGTVIFDIVSYDAFEESEDFEPYEFWGTYELTQHRENPEIVIITHTGGDPLVYGAEDYRIELVRDNR